MNPSARPCPYCGRSFFPSRFRPQQRVCSDPACQRRRRRDYHRDRLDSDPEYRQICRDSQKKWQEDHPDYPRQYRSRNPSYVERNRTQQRQRDSKRRLERLVKNNVAFPLKPFSGEVWLVGPELEPLVKNNLAFSQVLVLQVVEAAAGAGP